MSQDPFTPEKTRTLLHPLRHTPSMREEALESVSDKELTDTCSEMQSNELKTDIHGPRRRFTFLRRRENKEGKDKEKERAKFSIEGSYHLARPVRTQVAVSLPILMEDEGSVPVMHVATTSSTTSKEKEFPGRQFHQSLPDTPLSNRVINDHSPDSQFVYGDEDYDKDSLSVVVNEPELVLINEPKSWESFVDKKMVKKLSKNERIRQEIIYELILSERHHVRTMKVMMLVFGRGMIRLAHLQIDAVDEMMPGIEEIDKISTEFCGELMRRQRESNGFVVNQIGDILVNQFTGGRGHELENAYSIFCSRHEVAVEKFKKYYKTNKLFKKFMDKCVAHPVCCRIDFPTHIGLIVQRLGKYQLLLERLWKTTNNRSEAGKDEHQNIQQALEGLRKILRSVERATEFRQQRARLEALQGRMEVSIQVKAYKGRRRKSNLNLLANNGRLLYECDDVVWKGAGDRHIGVHVVLTTQLVVLLVEKANGKFNIAMLQDKRPPVIRLDKLMVRSNVTDLRALYVICTGGNPEMYLLFWPSNHERDKFHEVLKTAMEPFFKAAAMDEPDGIMLSSSDEESYYKSVDSFGSLDSLPESAREITNDKANADPARQSVVASLGPEGMQHFLEAIQKGTLKIARVNVDLLGDGEAGKSSVADSLMDEEFIEDRDSTIGANMIYMTQIATGYDTSWKRDDDRSHFLGSLLARGSVLAQQSSNKKAYPEKAELSKEEVSEVQFLPDTLVTEEDIDTHTSTLNTEEDWEPNSSGSAMEESSHMLQEVVVFGEKEFQTAKALTEEQALAIKSLQDNPDEMEKQKNLIHICVCDRGGQALYLPIHTAMIANCSEFIPKTYLLVFNLTKRLGDVATATFRDKQGRREIPCSRCQQLKNAEIIGRWATAVDLAHPEMCRSEATERQQRPFLGQHHVRRGPPMFIVGTHYDKIVEKGEDGQELLKQQAVTVRNVLSQHKYVERVVPVDKKSNEIIFKVDNTRSGTGSPDPMVNSLKKLIFDMAMAYRDDASATPLPYVVLELGLLNLSQPDGPGSPCDSERKVVALKDIVRLAQQYCDIEDDSRCRTALRYLSSVGAIFYFFKAAGLTDKVFTDPQWLFNVMSTFVTILTEENVSVQLLYDLKELKEEGRLSRRLAEDLLQRRPELGVKPQHYNTIFCLLQLVDVFCPALSRPVSSVEDAQMFYVPCMLEVEYEEETAWQVSSMTNVSHPPSLIFKASNVDSFPESLFFRLSSRTAYQFPDDPKLKRNRVQVFLAEYELELELFYHPSCRYVIATTFPVCNEEPPAPEVVNKHCVYVRRFLCWQLDNAKQNGMDGFQYEMYFQHEKQPGTMNVEDRALFRLPNCDEMPKLIINPRTKKRLRTDSLPIKSYYCCETAECEISAPGKKSEVTDAQLSMVADVARDKWWQIGVSLGLKKADLAEYEETRSLHYRLFCLLADWKRKAEHATVENIVVACQNAGVGGEVRRVLQVK